MIFINIILMLAAAIIAPVAHAQQAAPVPAVESAALPVVNAPVIIELFSSQACIFCPRADRFFADLAQQPNIIGLACHVDYFDVRTGSLSKPFCTQRQTHYMEQLKAGPNYTPQMVMQGQIDVVGYKMDEIVAGLKKAAQGNTARLSVRSDDKGRFIAALPSGVAPPENVEIWLALYDKPHEVTISEGRNKGQKMHYVNIVSVLQQKGRWPQGAAAIAFSPALTSAHAGFAVLAQDKAMGRILAAGQYKIPVQPSSPPLSEQAQ